MNKSLLTLLIIMILATVMYLISGFSGYSQNNTVACTAEARICPDGSAVGRSGPNCEFSPCPKNIILTPTTYKTPEISYWCGEIAGNKPCPTGYACRYQSEMASSGICEKCPEVDSVDCMPGPDKYDSRCKPEYLNWATSNCKGFKGASY